jgi:hypothetical protein
MTLTKMSLKEILDHMQELADNGMRTSYAFNQAFDEYTRQMLVEDDKSEIKNALARLEKFDVDKLNTENMVEQLEERLALLQRSN